MRCPEKIGKTGQHAYQKRTPAGGPKNSNYWLVAIYNSGIFFAGLSLLFFFLKNKPAFYAEELFQNSFPEPLPE